MSNFVVRKVAVLGAGVMGAQIAAHCVNAKVPVVLFDLPDAKGPVKNGIVLKAIEGLKKLSPAPLGNKDEQKEADEGTVEAWGRSADNPVGGWYGIKSGLRGRFGNYVPPVLEALGLAEVEHNARNNRMRATPR